MKHQLVEPTMDTLWDGALQESNQLTMSKKQEEELVKILNITNVNYWEQVHLASMNL